MFLETDDLLAVEPPVAGLSTAIDAEVSVDPAELDAEALAARSLRLRVEAARLAMAIAATDAEFERTKAFGLISDAASAPRWLASQLSMPVSEASAAYRFAARVAKLPMVFAAVLAGSLSLWHARKFTEACVNAARTRQMVDDHPDLIDTAGEVAGHDFAEVLDHWTETHFGDDIAARAEAAAVGRHASQSRTLNGQVKVDAALHPVYGTAFETMLKRIEHEMFCDDWNDAKQIHGEDTRKEHLWRSNSQRRADALVEMAMRADAAKPGATTRRPLVSVLIDFPTLHGRVCELENGVHLVPDQINDLLVSGADLERAVWEAPNRVQVSERARLFTGATRRAIELRDRRCTTPGCTVAPDGCDVHHVVEHAAGGLTTQDNGDLKCPSDHPNRRRPAADRPLPWEHVEHQGDQFADDTPDPERLDRDMTTRAKAARNLTADTPENTDDDTG